MESFAPMTVNKDIFASLNLSRNVTFEAHDVKFPHQPYWGHLHNKTLLFPLIQGKKTIQPGSLEDNLQAEDNSFFSFAHNFLAPPSCLQKPSVLCTSLASPSVY